MVSFIIRKLLAVVEVQQARALNLQFVGSNPAIVREE